MKKVLMITFCLIFTFYKAEAQKNNVEFVVEPDLMANVLAPTQVDASLTRGQHYKKPTWVIAEENGEATGTMGNISLVNKGLRTSTYKVGDTTFVLPNKDFQIRGNQLLNKRSQKVELLRIGFDECKCTPKTGLVFRRDSVTKNINPPHKMILWVEDIEWIDYEYLLMPAIPSELIDEVDSSENSNYCISIRTLDGSMCDIFWLEREEISSPNSHIVYKISPREAKDFKTENGEYFYQGKPIVSLLVLKEEPTIVNSKGIKRTEHQHRTHDK